MRSRTRRPKLVGGTPLGWRLVTWLGLGIMGISLLAAGLWTLRTGERLAGWMRNEPTPFVAERWKGEEDCLRQNPRRKMVRDLLDHHLRPRMTKRHVRALLGPPVPHDPWGGDETTPRRWTYPTGRTCGLLTSCACTYLIVGFDARGRVTSRARISDEESD